MLLVHLIEHLGSPIDLDFKSSGSKIVLSSLLCSKVAFFWITRSNGRVKIHKLTVQIDEFKITSCEL